ncbi:hypothetical protein C8R45DRAFT_1083495 [Mycena sanguinolenta]|nr:hypothetical protein C8R45DRAFT_1083495 [Mycena sanguinolenta]
MGTFRKICRGWNWEYHFPTLRGYFPGRDPFDDLNSIYNEISLRADFDAQLFDQGHFLLAPFGQKIVLVVVSAFASTLAYQQHFREVNLPTRIPREYVFIRFASNIFERYREDLRRFVKNKRKREVDEAKRAEKSRESGESGSERGGSRGGSRGGKSRGGGNMGRGNTSGESPGDSGMSRISGRGGLTEADLADFEAQDTVLTGECSRGFLTTEEKQAGRYPGFSAIERRKAEYWRTHPQISQVGGQMAQ